MNKIFCLLILVVLSACAPKSPQQVETIPPEEKEQALSVWTAYDHYAADREAENNPYRVDASLRFGKAGETRRVTFFIWSNGSPDDPVRLDAMAGIGVLVLRLREDNNTFVAFDPHANKAKVYKGKGKVRFAIGSAIPFGLRDFAALLRGRFHDIFGTVPGQNPVRTKQGNLIYTFIAGLQTGTLEIQPNGLPVQWLEKEDRGWKMSIDYDENDPPRPHKVSLTHPDGRTAILLVKTRESLKKHFTKENLALTLPKSVQIEQIKQSY